MPARPSSEREMTAWRGGSVVHGYLGRPLPATGRSPNRPRSKAIFGRLFIELNTSYPQKNGGNDQNTPIFL